MLDSGEMTPLIGLVDRRRTGTEQRCHLSIQVSSGPWRIYSHRDVRLCTRVVELGDW